MITLGLLSYVTAYVACVRPDDSPTLPPRALTGFNNEDPFSTPREARYSFDGPRIRRLFAPANSLDRRIRADTWTDYHCSDHFVPAIKTATRAYWSGNMAMQLRASHLVDVVAQADYYVPGNAKWNPFDTRVWQEEALLRSALDKE